MITDTSTCSQQIAQLSKLSLSETAGVRSEGFLKTETPLLETISLSDYLKLRNTAPELILGATVYTSEKDRLPPLHSFESKSELPSLNGESWVEVFHCPGALPSNSLARSGNSLLRISRNETHLFATWEAEVSQEDEMREATLEAYRSIKKILLELPEFHLWRCWNVIPSIHQKEGKLDRYMQFCQGREKALIHEGRLLRTSLPAASAVGSQGRKLQISFIAGKVAGLTVENPEQISAYLYPKQYGPASPSFSRSLLAGHQLWISGTASIAGHRSLHINNLERQLRETAARIHTLIECAKKRSESPPNFPASLKVFLRNPEDSEILLPLLRQTFPGGTRFHLVEAEICREELLIEIEGVTS